MQKALEGPLSASILQNVKVLKFCIEKTGSVDICGCLWNIVSPAFCKVASRFQTENSVAVIGISSINGHSLVIISDF